MEGAGEVRVCYGFGGIGHALPGRWGEWELDDIGIRGALSLAILRMTSATKAGKRGAVCCIDLLHFTHDNRNSTD